MGGKNNTDNFKGKQPQIQIAPRKIRSGLGGFKSVRQGRTPDTNNLQTNPLYQTLYKRRGYNRGGILSTRQN